MEFIRSFGSVVRIVTHEIVREFEEKDVLRRTTYPRLVVFHNEELRLNSREKLQEVHPDRDLQDIREAAEERREQRREQQAQADEGDETGDGDDDHDQEASDGDQADRDRHVSLSVVVSQHACFLSRQDFFSTIRCCIRAARSPPVLRVVARKRHRQLRASHTVRRAHGPVTRHWWPVDGVSVWIRW